MNNVIHEKCIVRVMNIIPINDIKSQLKKILDIDTINAPRVFLYSMLVILDYMSYHESYILDNSS